MRYDPKAIEGAAETEATKELPEEERLAKRDQMIQDEMDRMKRMMDEFESAFAWGPFRRPYYKDKAALKGEESKKSLEGETAEKETAKTEKEPAKAEVKVTPAESEAESAQKEAKTEAKKDKKTEKQAASPAKEKEKKAEKSKNHQEVQP